MLKCTCSHNRLEHVGGDLLADSHVLKCGVENCTCSKYHSHKDNDDSYLYKFISITLVFFAVGIGAFFIIGATFDVLLEPYTVEIIEKNPTHLVYENGTRVLDDSEINHKDNLSEQLKMTVFFGFYIMYAVLLFVFLMPVYETSKRKAINSK